MQQSDSSKDFFSAETELIRLTTNQMVLHRQYGNLIWNYWKEIKKIEIKRLESIYNILKLYMEQQIKLSGQKEHLEQIQQCFENFNLQHEFQQIFDIYKIFSPEEISIIKKEQELEELQSASFERFIQNQQFAEFEGPSLLIASAFSAKRETGKIKSSWQDCQLVFTIENNLIFMDLLAVKGR